MMERAFLWENGEAMRDLNDLVPAGSPHLAEGININNRGEIVVGALSEKRLYLLVPLPVLSIRHSEGSPNCPVIRPSTSTRLSPPAQHLSYSDQGKN
jgi:hypothetical protein